MKYLALLLLAGCTAHSVMVTPLPPLSSKFPPTFLPIAPKPLLIPGYHVYSLRTLSVTAPLPTSYGTQYNRASPVNTNQ